MKKILMAAAAAAVLMGTAAAASEASFTTVEEGKLKVATNPYLVPYEFYYIEEDGTPVLSGLDITLANRIADELGLELELTALDFADILSELQYGTIDLGISAFIPSLERSFVFDFSDLYYQSGQVLCVRKEDENIYKLLSDFDGHPLAVISGSVQYGLAKEYIEDADILGYPNFSYCIDALLDGTVDAIITEEAVANQVVKNNPQITILCRIPFAADGTAIALRKGNRTLLKEVNRIINEAREDGSIEKYMADAMLLSEDKENVFEGNLDDYYKAALESALVGEEAETE